MPHLPVIPELLLDARELSLKRGGRTVLEHISLQLPRGRILTLIGPNGAGKTSLVRLLLGLEQADHGTILRASDLRVGYMPQRLHVDQALPLSVHRFLRMGGASGAAIQTALDEVGIQGLDKTPLRNISGGELQRVLLARALLRKPNLLVLDEPAQGVDVNGQLALYQLISELRDRYACSVLMVSHDLHLVMAQTDYVVCLNQHICCHGHPEQVSHDPAYLALFGQQPGQVLAVYQHDHTHDHAHDDPTEELH